MLLKPAIAVVSISGVFPKAVGVDAFWRNICAKVEAVTNISNERRGIFPEGFYRPVFEIDKSYSNKAAIVSEHPEIGTQINLPSEYIDRIDPLHRWTLFAAYDAVEKAVLSKYDPKRIGVILAAIALPTSHVASFSAQLCDAEIRQLLGLDSHDVAQTTIDQICGRVVSSPAAMVAKALGFGAGCYTLDAACASSLYAVKFACDELQAYRADAMLAGGVSGADLYYTQTGFSQLKALSLSGRCAPFDHKADGLVVGEGAGILVLKRLDDAIRDQDQIYGVIRGIGLSNDMRGNLLAPESVGQLRAMQAAYVEAGWVPEDIDYIECHGAGTPVGDATELASLRSLWQDRRWSEGQCALGSVKSMIGHLLTGAGAAGMIKTLLALHHQTLPPSLNFEKPLDNSPLHNSPFRVQSETALWPQRASGLPRRAAVSAFGFGGINAHVLIEEWENENHGDYRKASMQAGVPQLEVKAEKRQPAPPQSDVAIVGMDMSIGSLHSLIAFQNAVFKGCSALSAPPQNRWRLPNALEKILGDRIYQGGFIPELNIRLGEFQIPPSELPDILPQQLLMLKTAAGALQDAKMPLRESRERMGAVIGIAYDYEATNFHLRWTLSTLASQWENEGLLILDGSRFEEWVAKAKTQCGPPLTATRTLGALGGIVASRIAREFRFGGPSFVVSAEEASGLRAVEIGTRLLQSGQVDSMLIGAVDLFCDERNLSTLFTRMPLSKQGMIRPFDDAADGTLPGEGSVAVVLKRLEDALKDGDRIYAVIKGFGNSSGQGFAPQPPSAEFYGLSLSKAIEESGISPASIGLVEAHGSGIPSQDKAEAEALDLFFRKPGQGNAKSISIGTTKPIIGYTGVISGLVSMAKATLSLFHEVIPPVAHFTKPAFPGWHQNPFYFPKQPAYWVRNANQGPRNACVAAITNDGGCSHLILQQAPVEADAISITSQTDRFRPMGALDHGLFILNGMDIRHLQTKLDELDTFAHGQGSDPPIGALTDLEHLTRQWFAHESAIKTNPAIALSIIASSREQLINAIKQARQAIENKTALQMDRTGGVCYLPEFHTVDAATAFVFPGSGNHMVGMGSTLATHWPDVLRQMDAETDRLKFQLLPHLYQPWRSHYESGWEAEAYRDLVSNPLHTIFGQVAFGSHMACLLKTFHVLPQAVIGYSLGESTGFFATGAWPDRGEMLQRLAVSDLFKTQLTGACLAARKAWNIPEKDSFKWRVAAVNRNAATVDKAIAAYPFVRRLIINTPDECVIGGMQEQLQAAIDQMTGDAVYLDGVVTVHCDAALPVAKDYKALHFFPTTAPEGIRYYSCAYGKAYALTSEKAADSILQQALHGFDFPRTVEQAYADGARIFLEIGPHASCTRMIRRILKDKPHVAVSAHVRGEDECFCLLKCLGTLAAAGMAIDLTKLYGYPENFWVKPAPTGSDVITIPVGGPSLVIDPPPVICRTNSSASTEQYHGAETKIGLAPEITTGSALVETASSLGSLLEAFNENVAATARVHERFLKLSQELTDQFGEAFAIQNQLMQALTDDIDGIPPSATVQASSAPSIDQSPAPSVAFDREQCMEFAIGSVGNVLGPRFDIIDTYPVRVRLPDEPLMLVDRILLVEGEMCGMGAGRVVTEHDVLPDAWYLDGNRAPVCIAVEAGQADLFLSGYLGIDHQVKGTRTYRLLDAQIVFHRHLPMPNEVIRYDIHIDKFVRQGQTYLFFFRFEGFIGGRHLITMTNGCAGFFTEQEVFNSGGIILTDEDRKITVNIGGTPFSPLSPQAPLGKVSYDDHQVEALRRGDAQACFGESFAGVRLPPSLRLPSGRMRLIDRIIEADPHGGGFGLGAIRSEADIHPDDWFLTCHFVDDMVMPGTLMYECCAHTLRVLLLQLGWVADKEDVCYEPVQGIPCRLKCRGPVTPNTRHVQYVVEIKEIGFHPEPYVLADAHMYADGRYIVFFKDMSMQLSGTTEKEIVKFWQKQMGLHPSSASPQASSSPPVLYSHEQILAFAMGLPSKAFGEPYKIFDSERVIARLPGPPYCFMDRITGIEPQPWVLKPDGWVEAQYDIPRDVWYFSADRSGVMPFCVLLEIALQPCGWLAAYMGSALKSTNDLKFRNLGGSAKILANIYPENQTLTMRTRMTKLSEAADMIIEHFDFEVLAGSIPIYTGDTYFGFFTASALAQQVGLRESEYRPSQDDLESRPIPVRLPEDQPFTPDEAAEYPITGTGLRLPAKALLMIDEITAYCPEGGPNGLGYIRGSKTVDPAEWFFKAHFHQDPVCPGSLGIESFLQLIKYCAMHRWPDFVKTHRFELLCHENQSWSYRGQVIPSNQQVVVDAAIIRIKDGPEPIITADGCLYVDGLPIYKMEGFGFKLVRK